MNLIMASNRYKISATIAQKYAPLISRSRQLETQVPKSEFATRREVGETNIDLWIDGSLYPCNPVDGKRPPFQTVSELLEYIGDGKSGLLSYTQNLCSTNSLIQFRLSEAEKEVRELREQVRSLSEAAHERERLLVFTSLEATERQKLQVEYEALLLLSESLKIEIDGMKTLYESCLTSLIENSARESDEHLQFQIDSYIEIETLKEEHVKKLQRMSSDLKRVKATLRRRDLRLSKLVKTPYGYRTIVRERRDLHTLAPKGGQAKRALRLARSILVPATSQKIQEENAATGSRQRLCGNVETQSSTAKVLTSLLSTHEVSTMCESTKLSKVGIRFANYYMDKIGSSIELQDIVETCDRNGITHNGYGSIYKKFKGAVKSAGKGLRISCLPNPHKVSLVRQQLNLKLSEYMGSYYSIMDSFEIPTTSKHAKKKEPIRVTLNEHNSFFVDVEKVQRTMVELYGITNAELQGDPLIFVIKLDEAEVVHAQKMERVSITLMNRALNTSLDPNSVEYFSVQSEREIWPIASFQIPKESHEILQWVFAKTKIPDLIEAQGNGQLLEVSGIGSFSVEWHLAADMKTIKCMFGLKMGANSLHSCIYCNQERVKTIVTSESKAISSRKCKWSDGLFSKNVSAKPLLGAESLGRWRPILAIPMDRVHVCTLHALNRIIEKIVHLHFMHIWTMKDLPLQKQAIAEMQRVVSLTGAHGGNVIIGKDEDLSGKNNSIPSKPSFSGPHALKLFAPNPTTAYSDQKLYVDVVNAEKNMLRQGKAKRKRLEQWIALDELRPYFSGLRLTNIQSSSDFKEKVEKWGGLYIKCFGEHHITHYMHIMVKHAPYFIDRYGSLAVWSCQGLENSHHAAKTAYQRHTQHGGGKIRKSPLLQTYQHWYRIIAHRFRNKVVVGASDMMHLELNRL